MSFRKPGRGKCNEKARACENQWKIKVGMIWAAPQGDIFPGQHALKNLEW